MACYQVTNYLNTFLSNSSYFLLFTFFLVERRGIGLKAEALEDLVSESIYELQKEMSNVKSKQSR